MSTPTTFVDVIHSPWCFIESPEESFRRAFEARWQVTIREFDLWEIEDEELDGLPPHIAQTIADLSAGTEWQRLGFEAVTDGPSLSAILSIDHYLHK